MTETTEHDGYGTVANITRMTGAHHDNASRDGHNGQPWSPWSAQVMVLAGFAGNGEPWLWLGCRNCGWFLGFSAQVAPDHLAAQAKGHRDHCPETVAPPATEPAEAETPQAFAGAPLPDHVTELDEGAYLIEMPDTEA